MKWFIKVMRKKTPFVLSWHFILQGLINIITPQMPPSVWCTRQDPHICPCVVVPDNRRSHLLKTWVLILLIYSQKCLFTLWMVCDCELKSPSSVDAVCEAIRLFQPCKSKQFAYFTDLREFFFIDYVFIISEKRVFSNTFLTLIAEVVICYFKSFAHFVMYISFGIYKCDDFFLTFF